MNHTERNMTAMTVMTFISTLLIFIGLMYLVEWRGNDRDLGKVFFEESRATHCNTLAILMELEHQLTPAEADKCGL